MGETIFSVDFLQQLFLSRISSLPFSISASLFVILLCALGIVEIALYIFVSRLFQFLEKKKDADIKDRIITMVANVLVFSDIDEPEAIVSHFVPRFARIPLYRPSIRRILVSQLLINHSSFSGRAADVLREIYLQLKLDRQARKNLTSRYWHKQIEAIRELTEMSIKDECGKILKYTNSRNRQLRVEAQTAYIRLCADNPFRFLDTVTEPMLDWHQLILFEVVTKAETMARPKFAYWLNSPIDSVVSFCLKLIEFYQQFDALPTLVYLINHHNVDIRAAAIDILGRMEYEMAETHFVAAYPDQPTKIKISILNALGAIGSGQNLSFLNSQAKSKEFPVRVAAIKAIRAHRREGRELLNTMFNEGVAKERELIRHFLDERTRV